MRVARRRRDETATFAAIRFQGRSRSRRLVAAGAAAAALVGATAPAGAQSGPRSIDIHGTIEIDDDNYFSGSRHGSFTFSASLQRAPVFTRVQFADVTRCVGKLQVRVRAFATIAPGSQERAKVDVVSNLMVGSNCASRQTDDTEVRTAVVPLDATGSVDVPLLRNPSPFNSGFARVRVCIEHDEVSGRQRCSAPPASSTPPGIPTPPPGAEIP